MACQRVPIVQNTGDTHLSFDIPVTLDFSHCFWQQHDDESLIQDMAGQGRCDLNVATPDPDNPKLYIQEQRTSIQIEAPLPPSHEEKTNKNSTLDHGCASPTYSGGEDEVASALFGLNNTLESFASQMANQSEKWCQKLDYWGTQMSANSESLCQKIDYLGTEIGKLANCLNQQKAQSPINTPSAEQRGKTIVHQGQSIVFLYMPSAAQNSTQGTQNSTDSLSVDYNNANSMSSDGAKKRKLSSMETLSGMLQLNNMEQKDLTMSARSLFRANKLYLARAFVLMLQYKEACRRWHSVAHDIKHFFYDDKSFDYRSKILPMDKCIDFYIQPTTRYPMTECRSFVAFTEFNGVWACYSFNIIQKVVCIMDPSSTTSDQDTIQLRHANNKKNILDRVLQYTRKNHGDPLIGTGDWQTSAFGSTAGQPTWKKSEVYALLCAELVKPDIGLSTED